MEQYNNIICISKNELINGGIISPRNYRYHKEAGNFSVERKGSRVKEELVKFSSLPENIKDDVKRVYGNDVVALALRNPLEKYLQNDVQAYDFFSSYRKPNTNEQLSKEKVREYTGNAIALNAIDKLFAEKNARNRALNSRMDTKATWEQILKALQALQGTWGWKMPTSERALRIKLNEYRANGYDSIIHKGIANDNSAKVADNEQQAALRTMMRFNRNFNDVQIQKMYNEIAKSLSWKTISEKTVGKRREEWRLTTEPGRRGETAFRNTYSMQLKRNNPFYPLLFWTLDGWDAELLYQHTTTNAKGHSVTTYHNHLVLEVVLDVCTKYPIGYAIGHVEDSGLIIKAARNALRHTRELFGCVYRPQQVQSDHFSIKTVGAFMETCTPRFTPARVKNAKAKPIEPYFKYLNTEYCQWQSNWGGFGVKAKDDNQPNVDHLNLIKHNFPDLQGCVQQLVDMIEQERAKKHDDFVARFKELPEEYKLPWNTEQYLYHSGEITGETNRMTGAGLIVTIGGTEHTYDCFDLNFRRHMKTDWIIKYDSTDVSTVLATNADGTLRFLMEEKHTGAMDLKSQTDADVANRTRVNRFNKELEEMIAAQNEEDFRTVDFLFSTHPELAETTAKFQLVDSNGQNKIHKKSKPAQIAETITVREEKKAERKEAREQQRIAEQIEADKQAAINEYHANKFDVTQFLDND